MAEKKKGLGNTLLGLFVVREDEEQGGPAAGAGQAGTGDAAVDDLIARYASGAPSPSGRSRPSATASAPASAPVSASTPGAAPPRQRTRPPGAAAAAEAEPAAATAEGTEPAGSVPDIKVDFPQVLRRAGLSDEEQGRVDRALTLLHALPAETPVEIKRQIVGASLQAFGIPVEQIIESAALHLRAYDRHIKEGQTQTQALLEQSNRRLAELEQEVARVKQVMQEQLAQQKGLTTSCNKQKLRVQEVLEFFGEEALNRVVQTSVKLRDKMNEP